MKSIVRPEEIALVSKKTNDIITYDTFLHLFLNILYEQPHLGWVLTEYNKFASA